MDQKQLLDAAKQQEGLTSDYELAQRLGVSTGRISQLRSGIRAADEAEISMLADMAKIDVHIALAAVHRDREKNPAKRAYWEKIAMQFSMAMLLVSVCLLTVFPRPAEAAAHSLHATNYAKSETHIYGMASAFQFSSSPN